MPLMPGDAPIEARREKESHGPCRLFCRTAARHWGDVHAILFIAALGLRGLATGQNGIIPRNSGGSPHSVIMQVMMEKLIGSSETDAAPAQIERGMK